MNIGAVIPARYGSKRVPHKNIRMLGHKPLICWTVDKLLEAGTFQNVCVSTESDEVADVVRQYYSASEVEILKRPDRLAGDAVSATEVFLHYMDTHPDIEFGGVFLPTYPFRSVEKLQEIDSSLRSRFYWRVMTESCEKYCSGEYYFPTGDGLKNIFTKHFLSCPIQTSTYVYHHRACPPGMWFDMFQTRNERALSMTNDFYEDIDIDTPEDFAYAQEIASGKVLRKLPSQTHTVGDWCFTAPQGVDMEKFVDYIGPERLESIKRPIMIAKRVEHAFASCLKLTEVFARQMFGCLESMVYIHKIDEENPSFNTQDMREQYTASKHYRIHRLPESYYTHTNNRDGSAYDHHGVDFCWDNYHTFSTEFVQYPRAFIGFDTLPWDRIIMEKDLAQQDFYVDPLQFKDPTEEPARRDVREQARAI